MLILRLLQGLLVLAMVQCRNKSACRHGDRRRWCSEIGNQRHVSTCYRHFRRCCDTCTRLKSPLPECPYGDKDQQQCRKIGKESPLTQCYTVHEDCCQTCHDLRLNITDCPYGDKRPSCDRIGSVYLVSACYQREAECCQTCHRLKNNIPECQYGDRETWCSLIGQQWPESMCEKPETWGSCCGSCIRLGHGVVLTKHSTTLPTTHLSTVKVPTRPTRRRPPLTRRMGRTTPTQAPSMVDRRTTLPSTELSVDRQTSLWININASISRTSAQKNRVTQPSIIDNEHSRDSNGIFYSSTFTSKGLHKNTNISLLSTLKPKIKSRDSSKDEQQTSVNFPNDKGNKSHIWELESTLDPMFSVDITATPKKSKKSETKSPSNHQENEILKSRPGQTSYSSWNTNFAAKSEVSLTVTFLFPILGVLSNIMFRL